MLKLLNKRFLLLAGCYCVSVFAEPKTVILATSDWQPYIVKEQPEQGKFTQIVMNVFNTMGMKIKFVYAPWKRVEAIVQSGAAYAAIPYSYTDERHKIFDYSVPLMDSTYVFLYNKKIYPNGINYEKLQDLSRYRIGGVTGYWYDGLFADNKLKVEYVTSDEQSIKKLYAGRIDLAATDKFVGEMLIAKLYPKETDVFGEIAKPFAYQCLHLMVSRNYPNAAELTQKFNSTFRALYAQPANAGCSKH